jgi:DNA polymerase delta subunit 1
MVAGPPLACNPDKTAFVGPSEGPVPIVRLYGVTAAGDSVLALVHGFTPYLYASVPSSVELSKTNLGSIRSVLDQRMKDRARGEEKSLANFVLGVEKEAGKQSLLGHHFGVTKDFIKVYCALPTMVPGLKRIFDEGFSVPGVGNISGQTYESNVPFVLRFMIDKNISGSDWIRIPAGTYRLLDKKEHQSRCSVELEVTFNNLAPQPPEGVYSSLAPLRVLSFDIECQGRRGHFPDALHDPVIQIANTVTLQGSDTPIIRNVFTLNSCLPIVGAQVIASATEEEMLLRWREFVVSVDPDILTGYNIANFDIPYLLNRAKALEKKTPNLKRFADLGK